MFCFMAVTNSIKLNKISTMRALLFLCCVNFPELFHQIRFSAIFMWTFVEEYMCVCVSTDVSQQHNGIKSSHNLDFQGKQTYSIWKVSMRSVDVFASSYFFSSFNLISFSTYRSKTSRLFYCDLFAYQFFLFQNEEEENQNPININSRMHAVAFGFNMVWQLLFTQQLSI